MAGVRHAELKGNEITLVLTIEHEGSPMTITFNGVVSNAAR